MIHVLYNSLAGHASNAGSPETLKARFDSATHTFYKVQDITSWRDFFAGIAPDDDVMICGGDGTLNQFINAVKDISFPNHVLYYPCGSGNDFMRDVKGSDAQSPICVDEYIKDLPSVTVNGQTYHFLNGVGYGIDGYCCEVGDQLRATSDKPVDYTGIAVKGLLFHYKPTAARVTVDGETFEYKRVWIAPTMHGRFYGGGMMPTPAQDRMKKGGKLSLLVMHNANKLQILMIFPSIFKGQHLKHTKRAVVHEGHDITVAFDRPVTLQIDGETILNVSEYHAVSSTKVKESAAMA